MAKYCYECCTDQRALLQKNKKSFIQTIPFNLDYSSVEQHTCMLTDYMTGFWVLCNVKSLSHMTSIGSEGFWVAQVGKGSAGVSSRDAVEMVVHLVVHPSSTRWIAKQSHLRIGPKTKEQQVWCGSD